MSIKKTLASLVLVGSAILSQPNESKSEIILSQLEPIKLYNSVNYYLNYPSNKEVLLFPTNNKKYLHEGQQILFHYHHQDQYQLLLENQGKNYHFHEQYNSIVMIHFLH